MSSPPEWLQITGVIVWSTALTVGVFWQPKWMHRLMTKLARWTERLYRRIFRHYTGRRW